MNRYDTARALGGAALVIALSLTLSSPLRADPPPFEDFTFKRVKPPKASGGQRITVQITDPLPQPKPKPKAEDEAAPPATPTAAALDWFWTDISPALTDAGPDRLAPALVRLSNPPAGTSVPEPRLSDLLSLTERYGADILMSTIGTRVSPALALAVISVESGGRADATSSAGAQGVMQLMPAAAERFGVTDRLDAAQNIRGGVRYLDQLMKDFGNDPVLVLAGYNAGENAVRRHEGVPPYAETRDYVPKVLAAFAVARGLCLTPPELVSDGCAFRQP
ncbi:lytic transglycosylase domain-containing protein [Pseudooceanicola onchidii]|uniref:lytic transglycosylase domain-containing protein n=1 Tax=Pseudooceanicola onchidii TaxID=2562279 RepID=UPI0010A9F8ED|nr:lytic transglycosylase domain-containing protein [Pseudooceanicola onchidii]